MNHSSIFSIRSLLRADTLFPPKSSFSFGHSLLRITWVFVIFTVLSGAVRKWMAGPGPLGNAIFLAQILFPFIFYFVLSRSRIRSRFRTPIMFTFFMIYLLIAAINPMNLTVYHGIFGIIIHLGFWLCLVGYYKTRPFFEVEKLTNLFIAILIAEVVLASVQYSLPGSHVLNVFATGEENKTFVGNAVRVAGTFAYIGGFQAWVSFYGFFIWFLFVRKYPAYMIIIVFSLSLFAGLVSGSRSAVAMQLFTSAFAFLYTGFFMHRFFNVILQVAILSGVFLLFGENVVDQFKLAYSNFQDRVEWGINNGELEGRVVNNFEEVFDFKGKYPVYGIGLGSTYQGANLLFGESLYAKDYGYYESELARVVLEGGFILFFLRIIVFIILLKYSYIPLIGKIYLLAFMLNNMVIFNTYQSIFFALGIIMVDRAYFLNATGLSNPIFEKNKLRQF